MLLAIVNDISPLSLIEQPGTSQNLAFDWLVNDDFFQACPEERNDVEQRYILAVLYFNNGGDDWSQCNADNSPMVNPCFNGDRFLSGSDVCLWFGISCQDDLIFDVELRKFAIMTLCLGLLLALHTQIDSYSLGVYVTGSNGLVGTIPSELSSLSGLEILFLDRNELTGTIPSVLFTLSNLGEKAMPQMSACLQYRR